MKKGLKIALITITLIVLLGTVFAFIDYTRLKNDKKPIFIYRNVHVYTNTKLLGVEYYGLGYSIFDCKECMKKIKINPLYFSTYAWFISSSDIDNVKIIESEKCNSKAELYYSFSDNRNVYTYCLDDIKITEKNENSFTLKDYLNMDNDVIYDIIEKFTIWPEASFDDGGTKIFSGENFNILVCKTISDNNNIYIGTKTMGYNKGFCE
ncbi:MAG: hypothetical protein PHS24_03290 [Bacilli bacterium]|nr:hypothetical protein [Bacilli bacterium]